MEKEITARNTNLKNKPMPHKAHILIIHEPNSIEAELTNRLKKLGYVIVGPIKETEDAIKILQETTIDIILIDTNNKEDKDHLYLTEQINSRFGLPFLFLISSEAPGLLEKVKTLKPSGCLHYPWNNNQLELTIEIAMGNFLKYNPKSKSTHLSKSKINNTSLKHIQNCLFLKKKNHFERVYFNDILWIEANGNYSTFYTTTGNFTYATTLRNFEQKLPQDQFKRVHRSFIVNINRITGFEGNMILVEKSTSLSPKQFGMSSFKPFM